MYLHLCTHIHMHACTYICTIVNTHILWNLSVMDTLGPDIFGYFLLQYRGFLLSELRNVLVMPVRTKIFVLIKVLIWKVW